MKLNTKALALACLAAFALLFAVSTPAQNLRDRLPKRPTSKPAEDASKVPQQKTGEVRSEADTCAATFTNAGTNNSYMEFCVSTNGNIISFQSPVGIEYLNLGTLSEGYGLCDVTTGASYYDFSDYGASGFGAATFTHTATLAKIVRTTSDLAWTLTQTITKLAGATPYAKVSMALKNNSLITKDAYLLRWADVDPYNANSTASFLESFDSTVDGAWGYTSEDSYTGPNDVGYGLAIETIGVPLPTSVPSGWLAADLNTNLPPDPCNPIANFSGYQASVDGSIEVLYFLELKKDQIGTVNSRYFAL